MDYIFGFLHHLAFCNPEGSLCHGDGEVVDLNAIELSNGHLDGVAHIQHDLSLVKEGDGFVLQPPEGDIGFGEEVPGAAGRVQKFQASQFPLKRLQFGLAGPIYRDSGNFLKTLKDEVGAVTNYSYDEKKGTLQSVTDADRQTQERFERLIEGMKQAQGLTKVEG